MKILTTSAPHCPLMFALEKQGCEVLRIAKIDDALEQNLEGCSAFMGNIFDDIKKPRMLLKLKKRLRRLGIPYVFWNRDAPWNCAMRWRRKILLRLIQPVDIYLAHSLQGHRLFNRHAGYFPNAAQERYSAGLDLEKLRDETQYEYDVSFIGAFGSAKSANNRKRAAFLNELKKQLIAAGPKIRLLWHDTHADAIPADQQMAIIRKSKINLNLGAICDLPGEMSWGLPERIFGIPAGGGFLLTEDRKHLQDTFGQEQIDSFASVEACSKTTLHYLANFTLLREKAERLHHLVMENHTYESRALTLMKIIGDYRRSPRVEKNSPK